MTIAELQEDRVVEAVYAVRMKRKLRTKSGASYLALELVDPTGRVEARVWNDVELLDGRFAEGDAVRVLARVEKFRDRLQLDVRSLESADVDPQTLTPSLRRDRDELGGFLEFLVAELSHPGLRATVEATLGDSDLGGVPGDATTITTRTPAGCSSTRSASRRSPVRRRSSIRGCASDLLLAAALVHDVGRTVELGPGPAFSLTPRGAPARARAPRAQADRGARGGPELGAARGAPPLRRGAPRRTRCADAPRQRCCTTPTSSTRSRQLARSIDAAPPRARRQPRLGCRRLLRPARQPDARRPAGAHVGAGRRRRLARDRGCGARATGRPAGRVLYAIGAAFGGMLGLYAYYRGMLTGTMSVVAPVAGVSAVIPVIFGIATGDDPSVPQVAGVAAALAGVGLASIEHQEGRRACRGRGRSRAARGVRLRLLLPVDARGRQGRLLVGVDGVPDDGAAARRDCGRRVGGSTCG